MRRPQAFLGVLLAAGLVTAGCGTAATDDDGAPTAPAARVGAALAIGTTTMLGDVVGDIMECAGGTAETLMPVGADPHDFSPSSEQVASMVGADLVVANGLGLEGGLEDVLEAAETDGATVLRVAPLVDPIEFSGEHADEQGEEHADEHGSLDPHFWQDVARMAAAAELIGAELAEVTGDDAYAACGTQVHDALMETDATVREILAVVPPERRVMVTDHDAFGYLADAYDFEVAGVVVPGGSTLAEPSNQELSQLVSVIEDEGVRAIFSNTAVSSAVVDAVAAEVGTQVEVVELFVDTLGPEGSGADTYAGMVTTNARLIADALS